MESLGLSLEDADILANSLLESMNLIKIDIEKVEFILQSLNKKYKNTEKEYLDIFEFTTEAKEIKLEKKELLLSALELDKILFLERQKKKIEKLEKVLITK
jgi:hypothetical protein